MIRMIMSQSAGQAKDYFTASLQKSDYFINDQEAPGSYHGLLFERLGVSGLATKKVFFDMCENINPQTGEALTPRTKDGRTVGYDINFHAPKSVSICALLEENSLIPEIFKASVKETMREIEADAMTRVRKKGQYEDRQTGELAWAEFMHFTARPTENMAPDPHLHTHAFVFNATWDEKEREFKAGQFRDIKRDMPYYQARFHKKLSDKLIGLGYDIRRTEKSFEITGVPQAAIDLFSKRTNEIGQIAKEHNITDPEALSELGARTRAAKNKGLTMAELKSDWRNQLQAIEFSKEEKERSVRGPEKTVLPAMTAKDTVDFAIDHSFERVSVLADRRLLAAAYTHSIGHKNVTLDDITRVFSDDSRIIHVTEKYQTLCTTHAILSEEKKMVSSALQGQGKFTPLYQTAPKIKKELEGQQANAIDYILTTPNQLSIVRGVAGAGKTAMLSEAAVHIRNAGKQITIVAPSASASRGVLVEEGFDDANTVARLLVDETMQDQLKDQVLIVDEAGLLGTSDMSALLRISEKQNARLILVGDTRQHSSVLRGDALRVLNTVGGINVAEIDKIRRQKDLNYRSAVEDLAKGNITKGFSKLDRLAAIKTVDPLNPNEELVKDYLRTVKRGKSALIISPTHEQGKSVTHDLRKQLKASRLLGKKESKVTRFENLNYTDAQKSDWRNFKAGQTIQFSQNAPQIKRGSKWLIQAANEANVIIQDNEGKTLALPLEKTSAFNVYKTTEIGLAKGDKLKITQNSYDENDKRIDNGDMFTFQSIDKNGKMTLVNPKSKSTCILDREFGNIDYAYCATSHASQGKTVDEIYISQPAATFGATSAKQFYVSVSRGRDAVHIYTDDKEELLERASRLDERQSAIELVEPEFSQEDYAVHLERTTNIYNTYPAPVKDSLSVRFNPYEEYEPEL